MHRDTIAIHGGYEDDPTTKSVAVPIYQTASFVFPSYTTPSDSGH